MYVGAMYVCMHVGLWVCMFVYMYVCIYVCVYVCVGRELLCSDKTGGPQIFLYSCCYLFLCMHVCMYVHVYVRFVFLYIVCSRGSAYMLSTSGLNV